MPGALVALCLAVAGLTVPTAAEADDQWIQADPAITDACLARATRDTREACIGAAARECSGHDVDARPWGPEAAALHRRCKGSEAYHWDRLVSEAYLAMFRKESRRDKLRWILTESQVAPQIAFAQMHQAWQQMRSATCRFEWAQNQVSLGVGVEENDCRLHMTAQFYFELTDRLAGEFSWN